MQTEIEIRPLAAEDLPAADRIFRLAFGTFLGMPDPAAFMGDADLTNGRWRAAPDAALGAYAGGMLVGSNFATRWGDFGFLGPLTVHPDHWRSGVGRRLMTATMTLFERWGTRRVGLFTFPDSPLHIGLYRSFGFAPQELTPVMSKPVASPAPKQHWATFSAAPPGERDAIIAACRELASAVDPGLDPTAEILAVAGQGRGDTILLRDGRSLAGFAVCHLGAGSEAGSGAAYVKFAAVRPGAGAADRFEMVLDACEAAAAAGGAGQLVAGVNEARSEALRILTRRGFQPFLTGIAMQRPDVPGHNRPDCLVLDDWR